MRQVLAKLLGEERLRKLPRGSAIVVLAAGVIAAGLGPAAALALGDSGGSGLGGSNAVALSATGTTGATPTGTTVSSGYYTTTSTVVSGTTTSTVVTVTTPCSGSLGTSTTTTGAATTTTVPTTTTVDTTATSYATITTYTTVTAADATSTPAGTTTTPAGTTTTPAGTTTTAAGTTTTPPTLTTTTLTSTTATPVTTPTTATVPTTATETTPGVTTVTTTPACQTVSPPPTTIAVPKTNPFRGRAMWIWELQSTNGGSVASIIAQAKRYGINAVYVKSSDGTSWWPQYSRELVTELHQAGLRVCAWQYVYGVHPAAEANLGSRAAHDGADCLVIDAESEYQSRYIAAQTYMTRLRKLVGQRYPIGLASFPYIDYHLSFPYSVFLGPGGAQYNLPQMYWADIGTTVPFVFAHTYEYNEIYRRPIYPLGQLWGKLSAGSIEQFTLFAKDYGATGISWWDWQSAPLKYFADITRLPPQLVSNQVNRTPASLFRGNKGDIVIWAQEHLHGAGLHIAVDGVFGPRTQAAVRTFQRRKHLAVTGTVNGPTWDALDRLTPVTVRWTRRGRRTVAVVARDGNALVEPIPSWMRRVHPRNELHRDVGAGGRPSSASR